MNHTLSKIFIGMAALFLFTPGFSQTRGNMSTISTELPFAESFTNVTLDPSPLTGNDSKVTFTQDFSNTMSPDIGTEITRKILNEALDVDVPDWVFILSNFFCSGIQPTFSTSASVKAGAYYSIHSVGNSDIEIQYPVEVLVEYPEPNSFACGDVFKIKTSYIILNPDASDKLKVRPPFLNQEIGPVFENPSFSASIGLSAWYGIGVDYYLDKICKEVDDWEDSKTFSLSTNVPSLPAVLNLCESAFGEGANEASLLSCGWSSATPLLELGQRALDIYEASHHGEYSFAYFPNTNTVEIETPDLPSGAPAMPEIEGLFKNITAAGLTSQSLDGGQRLQVSGTDLLTSRMRIDLISLLDYAGKTTSLSLGGGFGSIDFGDISPTFIAKQNINFEFSPVIHIEVNLGKPMDYSVYEPDGNKVAASYGQTVNLIAGQYIELKFPQNCSTPISAEGNSLLKGNFKTNLQQEYSKSLNVKFGEVKVSGLEFEVINENIGTQKFDEDVILDHTIELETTNRINLSAFSLDPENPVINVSYLKAEDVLNTGGGERAVVYKLGITNDGDVKLNNLQLDFDLSNIYSPSSYSVECLYSSDFDVNPQFDGATNINLIAEGNSFDSGESGYIEVLVKVKPQIASISSEGCFEPVNYSAKAKAYGVSPIGTRVENNYNQCTEEVTGDDLMSEVDLGAAVISSINDFTLYGRENVKIDKSLKLSMGNIGSSGDVVFENSTFFNGSTAVIIGDIHANEQLFIQGQSKVEADYIVLGGSIKEPNWKSMLKLNGAASEVSSCVSFQPVKRIEYVKKNPKEKILIARGESMHLAPGDYGLVQVSEGAEIIMSAGVYNIDSWMFLGNNAVVRYQLSGGSLNINLGSWQAPGRENLKFVIDGNGNPKNVLYNYAGNQKCSFKSSVIQGRIFAPEAEIEFSDGSVLEGTCYAAKVNFKTGSSFTGLKYLTPLKINSACQNIVIPGQPSMLKSNFITESNSAGNKSMAPEGEMHRLQAYPNPTDGVITITGLPGGEKVNIRIYNSTGQIVRQLVSISSQMKVNLKTEPAGLYYIKVDNFNSIAIVKK